MHGRYCCTLCGLQKKHGGFLFLIQRRQSCYDMFHVKDFIKNLPSGCEFVCRMRKGAPGSWKKRERPENGLKPGFLGRKRPGKSGKSADFTMRVRKQKTALLGPFFVFEWMRARLSKTAF